MDVGSSDWLGHSGKMPANLRAENRNLADAHNRRPSLRQLRNASAEPPRDRGIENLGHVRFWATLALRSSTENQKPSAAPNVKDEPRHWPA